MNEWKVRDKDTGNVWHKDSRPEAEEAVEDFGDLRDLEIIPPSDASKESGNPDGANKQPKQTASDGGELTTQAKEDIATSREQIENGETVPIEETKQSQPVSPEQLSKNPIDFLKSVNSDFVNEIRGKPAISKQGFRFIQREFEISTESEVVEWSEDPLGCVVWAKAELDNGYSAEAHGEGYQFESDVSDNEFVRYADTRAKNRAISDLTSAGALAVSELTED